MTKPKFTEGPWAWDDSDRKGDIAIDSDPAGWYELATVYKSGGVEDDSQGYANARLIAKAPEMYAAIKMILEETNAGMWDALPIQVARDLLESIDNG